jgi:hypothetical protein
MYATSLDLNMGYYHMLLTPPSSRLCTIVLPWGKYEYYRLPMGLSISPDVFQEKMSELHSVQKMPGLFNNRPECSKK